MLRWIGSLSFLAALTVVSGCATPLTKTDLWNGAVEGHVVDAIPAIDRESMSAAWYLEIEHPDRSVSRITVTRDAWQAVDMGDYLPDDLRAELPPGDWRERENTPWP